MNRSGQLFFQTSERTTDQITEIYDFIWPTAAAMWNLRWQVDGYLRASPNADTKELSGRFLSGSGIRSADLKKTCLKTSWENQQNNFAKFLLIEFCALYESWCEGVSTELALPKKLKESTTNNLQFPSSARDGGVSTVFAQINAQQCAAMHSTIYPQLKKHRKNSITNLENLLVCYRYFKEARNFLAHGSNRAESNLIAAEQAYSSLGHTALGLKEAPFFIAHTLGDDFKLNLRGVVGFGDVVLRLICTLDSELAYSSYAEALFVQRWKDLHGNRIQIAADPLKGLKRVNRLVHKLGISQVNSDNHFRSWLQQHSLI